MFQDLLIYGAPALTFGLGYFIAKRGIKPDNSGYWEAIAGREEKKAETNWSRFVDACRECNTIEEELQDALASNRRLSDALAAKNARLERIYEKGSVSKSGAAVHLAKIAEGLV